MSTATEVLKSLPPELHQNGVLRVASSSAASGPGSLAKGRAAELEASFDWQACLSAGQLPRGGVIELASEGGVALGTSIALRACQRVQQEAHHLHGVVPWCAFVDPTESLYAPGVHAAGIDLSKLLVVRPDEENITRVALRLVESKVFPLVVVDLMGLPCDHLDPSLKSWVRVVRRLSLALSGISHSVVLLTDQNARRSLPLPVSERLVLSRRSTNDLHVNVSKSAQGSLGHARIRWARKPPERLAHAS